MMFLLPLFLFCPDVDAMIRPYQAKLHNSWHRRGFFLQGCLAPLLPENVIFHDLSWKVARKSALGDLHLESKQKIDFPLGLCDCPPLGHEFLN